MEIKPCPQPLLEQLSSQEILQTAADWLQTDSPQLVYFEQINDVESPIKREK